MLRKYSSSNWLTVHDFNMKHLKQRPFHNNWTDTSTLRVNAGLVLAVVGYLNKEVYTVKPLFREHLRDRQNCSLFGGVPPRGGQLLHHHQKWAMCRYMVFLM